MSEYYKMFPELPKLPKEHMMELRNIAYDPFTHTTNPLPCIDHSWSMSIGDQFIRLHTELELSRLHGAQYTPKCDVPESIKIWIQENIGTAGTRVTLTPNLFKGDYVLPHLDRTRKYAMLYLLNTGGKCVHTCFYTPINGVIPAQNPRYNQVWTNRDDLELVDFVQIPAETWTCIRVDVPHAVYGLQNDQRRIALQVSLDTPYSSFV